MTARNTIAEWKNLDCTYDGIFWAGRNGVKSILSPLDGRSEFVVFQTGKILVTLPNSAVPVYYPLISHPFQGPAKAVLMDLDGTSIKSEGFWIGAIEQTVCSLMGNPSFRLSKEDIPFVSGFSVSEHLKYCIAKYHLNADMETARKCYMDVVRRETREILEGKGRENAYMPAPGLKKFLLKLKESHIKIGLVTSGLYEKAMPEIISGFREMDCRKPYLGEPMKFYDAVITAGTSFGDGCAGTLGELCAKPHPWLYREICEVGLGIHEEEFSSVIVLEDSAAGVLAARLAGFDVIGMRDGNIEAAGLTDLVWSMEERLENILPCILGKEERF